MDWLLPAYFMWAASHWASILATLLVVGFLPTYVYVAFMYRTALPFISAWSLIAFVVSTAASMAATFALLGPFLVIRMWG